MRLSIQSRALFLLAATAASAFVFQEQVKSEMRAAQHSGSSQGGVTMTTATTTTPSCSLLSSWDFTSSLRAVDVEIDVMTKEEGSIEVRLLRQISNQVFDCHKSTSKQLYRKTIDNNNNNSQQKLRWTQKVRDLGVSTFSIKEVTPISCPPKSHQQAIYSCGRAVISLEFDESIHTASPESTERARALIGAALSNHAMTLKERDFPQQVQFRDLRAKQAKSSKAAKMKAKSSKQSPLWGKGKGLTAPTAPTDEPLDTNDAPSSSIPTQSPAGNAVQQDATSSPIASDPTSSSIPTQSPAGNAVQQDATSSPVACDPTSSSIPTQSPVADDSTGEFEQDEFNPDVITPTLAPISGTGGGGESSTSPSTAPTTRTEGEGSTTVPSSGPTIASIPSMSPTMVLPTPTAVPTTSSQNNASPWPSIHPTWTGELGGDSDGTDTPSDVPSMVPSIAPTPSDGSHGTGSTPTLGTDGSGSTPTDDTIDTDGNTSSSDVPSDAPSDVPSMVPSTTPTLLKSDYPSINPMEWPEVTVAPADSPSTTGGTTLPTLGGYDSGSTPTDDTIDTDGNTSSSDVPSDVPSTVPSTTPTLLKSDYPSIYPVEWPEVTVSPADSPTTTDGDDAPSEDSYGSGSLSPSDGTIDTDGDTSNSDAPSDVPSMVPSLSPTSIDVDGPGSPGGDEPTTQVPTPDEPTSPTPGASPTLPRICEASDGDFGNEMGIATVVSFAYELEVDPLEVSATVSSEVLPTLEQTMVEFLLPVLFPEICREWDSSTSTTQLGSGRHRRLAALGISSSPTDQVLNERECKQLDVETNDCSFVAGYVSIHHYFVDPESLQGMIDMVLERLKLGMDTGALLSAHHSIKRISFANISTESPTISPSPTTSESPSVSKLPTTSPLPTTSESPSVSSAPTVSELPTISLSPSIFVEDSLPEAIVDGGATAKENDRVGIGLGVALAAVLVLLILALLVGRHQIVANRKQRTSDVGLYGVGLLPLAGGFGDDNRRIVGTGDPPGSFHEGLYHYTDEGTRYLSTNCADCMETRRNSFYTDDNLGTIPEDQEYEDAMYCAPAMYTSDDDSEVMASSYLQHLVQSRKIAPPDVHVCTSTMCTDPRCSNRNKPYSPRQSTTFLENPAAWVDSREIGLDDEPMDSLLTLGYDDRTSTRAGEQEV